MSTTRRRRRQEARTPLEIAMRAYRLTGSHTAAMAAHDAAMAAAGITGHTGFAGLMQYLCEWPRHEALWRANGDELIAGGSQGHPGRRAGGGVVAVDGPGGPRAARRRGSTDAWALRPARVPPVRALLAGLSRPAGAAGPRAGRSARVRV